MRAFDAFRRSVARSLPDRPRVGAAPLPSKCSDECGVVSGSLDEDGKQRLTANDASLPILDTFGARGRLLFDFDGMCHRFGVKQARRTV